MTKSAVADWSTTAASNTDIADIDITGATGKVKDGDNAIREIMAQVAEFYDDFGAVNTVGGTADAVTVTLASGITAYATGQTFRFIAGAANTGAATMNVNGIGAKAIRKISGGTDVALAAGDLAAGVTYEVMYRASANSAAGAWVIVSASVATATTSQAGIVELATNEEAVEGTSTSLAVTPNGLAAAMARRSRIDNGAMQISQENGNTAGTTNGYYVADRFYVEFSTSAGTITSQRVQSVTPNGSKDRARITITAADASLAASEILALQHRIEGQDMPDFRYGSASAQQSILRFGFKGPAGTYAAALRNSALNRSYVALFTIDSGDANTDTEQELVIPGDTTGTWLTDTGVGCIVEIVLAAGSGWQGTTGWQAGNVRATSAVSNGMGTVSSVFEIFDIGLYLDEDSTGKAPAWELPDYAETERKCQRQYWKITAAGAEAAGVMGTCNGSSFIGVLTAPVTMRATPSLVTSDATTFSVLYGGTNTAITSGPTLSQANTKNARLDFGHGAITNAAAGYLYFEGSGAYLGLSARL